MVFTNEGFIEVATENWPEWDLNPRPINTVRNNLLSYEAMSSARTKSQLCTATSISSFDQCSHFILAIAFVSRHVYVDQNFAQVITQCSAMN